MALFNRTHTGAGANVYALPARNSTTALSYSIWVKVGGVTSTSSSVVYGYPLLCFHDNGALSTTERCLSITPDAGLNFYNYGATGADTTTGAGIVPCDQRWHNLGITFNSGAVRFYVDGRLRATGTSSQSGMYAGYSAARFRVGGSYTTAWGAGGGSLPGDARPGMLAEAAHWDAVLQDGDFADLFARQRSPLQIRRANLGCFISFANGNLNQCEVSGTRGTIDTSPAFPIWVNEQPPGGPRVRAVFVPSTPAASPANYMPLMGVGD